MVNDLVTLGRVRRPALGIRTIPIDPEVANELGLAADYGLLIVQAVPGGSADRAGLRGGTERAYLGNTPIMIGGDLIVAIDGEEPLAHVIARGDEAAIAGADGIDEDEIAEIEPGLGIGQQIRRGRRNRAVAADRQPPRSGIAELQPGR